jgi:hypothetical protein
VEGFQGALQVGPQELWLCGSLGNDQRYSHAPLVADARRQIQTPAKVPSAVESQGAVGLVGDRLRS